MRPCFFQSSSGASVIRRAFQAITGPLITVIVVALAVTVAGSAFLAMEAFKMR